MIRFVHPCGAPALRCGVLRRTTPGDSLRSPLRGAYAALRRRRHCVPFERRVRIKSSLSANKKGASGSPLECGLKVGIDSLRSPLRGAYAALRRRRHCVPFERRVRIKSSLSANKKGASGSPLECGLKVGIDSLRSPLRGAYAALRRRRHCVPFERRVRIKSSLSANKKGAPIGAPFLLAEREGFEPSIRY
ncbi:hypothetical protein [Candidatus Thiodiazotropha endoloripes]|uniref:hypothetical protein n=1 Tax=Candidatus Thiodiazotropha endoloripes TaxID=1818881 RepID=UPI00114D2A0A|nr:hypothetical protein [Candidatus Thiodiazotropha endoloripes]